jgi:hypothetical protein
MKKQMQKYLSTDDIWAQEILSTATIKGEGEEGDSKALDFGEAYDEVVVGPEFVKEHSPKKGKIYYSTKGGAEVGCMSKKELAEKYKKA